MKFYSLLQHSDIYKYIGADEDQTATQMLMDFAQDVSNMTLLEASIRMSKKINDFLLEEDDEE